MSHPLADFMNCDAQSLVTAAACLECQIPAGMQDAVIIYLLCQIASNGSGGAAGISCGNYSGGQPNFTPATTCAVAVDTSSGRPWWYFNSQWN